MAYCSASAVAGLCRNLLGQEQAFSFSSCPTINDVNQWLSSGCSIIESQLAGFKYTVPVSNGTAAYDWLAHLNALYGAAYAEMSRTNVTLGPQERTRGQIYLEQFWNQLTMLGKTDFTLAGLSRTTYGTLYTGGVSVADKNANEDNIDRVPPRFFRGLGRFSDTIQPTANTSEES